jgi:hypothetical protein
MKHLQKSNNYKRQTQENLRAVIHMMVSSIYKETCYEKLVCGIKRPDGSQLIM